MKYFCKTANKLAQRTNGVQTVKSLPANKKTVLWLEVTEVKVVTNTDFSFQDFTCWT